MRSCPFSWLVKPKADFENPTCFQTRTFWWNPLPSFMIRFQSCVQNERQSLTKVKRVPELSTLKTFSFACSCSFKPIIVVIIIFVIIIIILRSLALVLIHEIWSLCLLPFNQWSSTGLSIDGSPTWMWRAKTDQIEASKGHPHPDPNFFPGWRLFHLRWVHVPLTYPQ